MRVFRLLPPPCCLGGADLRVPVGAEASREGALRASGNSLLGQHTLGSFSGNELSGEVGEEGPLPGGAGDAGAAGALGSSVPGQTGGHARRAAG